MQRKRATVREDLCEQLMQGEPLDQERRVVGALIDSLEPQDRLELVEFSTSARRWRRSAAEATEMRSQVACPKLVCGQRCRNSAAE